MKIYRINRTDISGNEATQCYAGTFAEAKRAAKALLDVYVDLVELKTDKASIVALLNGRDEGLFGETERSWEKTPRGGLTEIKE